MFMGKFVVGKFAILSKKEKLKNVMLLVLGEDKVFFFLCSGSFL
jgi:hypothetical protein